MADNSDPVAKRLIREWALDKVGGVKKAHVLELFGGEGHMHDTLYKGAKKHLAFDMKGIERGTWLQGDNRVLLQKHVNGWDLYDADAYVNPWPVLTDIARMREPGKYTIVATCSVRRGMAGGNANPFFRWATGYGQCSKNPLMIRFYWDMLGDVFRIWKRYGVTLHEGKIMRSQLPGALHVFYYGFMATKGKA